MLQTMSLSGMGILFGMILGWVIIILAVLWLLQWLSGDHHSVSGTPLELLQRRYARGEMNRREYLERRADLLGEHPLSESTQVPPKKHSPKMKKAVQSL